MLQEESSDFSSRAILAIWHIIVSLLLLGYWRLITNPDSWFILGLGLLPTLCYLWMHGLPLKSSNLKEFAIFQFVAVSSVHILEFYYLFAAYVYFTLPINRFHYYPEYRGYAQRQLKFSLVWAYGWVITFFLSLTGSNWMEINYIIQILFSYEDLTFLYFGIILPFQLLIQLYGIPLFKRNPGQNE